jgi:hypothetical protein
MRARSVLVALAAAVLLALAFAPARETRWWKGNIHTHTLWSDGNDFPEMVVDWYRQRGDYHFLALTDHNILADHEKWMENDVVIRRGGRTALSEYRDRFGEDQVETRIGPATPEGEPGKLEVRLKTLDEFRGRFEADGVFLLMAAEEISDSFERLPIHINATNLAELIKPQGGDSVRDVIQRNLRAVREQAERRDQPILAHVNHPNFGWAITAEDLAHVEEEKFFEVFNGHPSVHHLGDEAHAGVERAWDIANAIRIQRLGQPPLFGVATDDSHNYHNAAGSIPGRGWVQVRATDLAPRALIAAMEAGEFYASTGVTLAEVRFDDETLDVRVEPAPGETYRIDFVGTLEGVDLESEPVRDAEGNELHATRRYSPAIGSTLASIEGTDARYRFTGGELYVRAVITASAAPEFPVWEGQRKQAWTQPVGWRTRVEGR